MHEVGVKGQRSRTKVVARETYRNGWKTKDERETSTWRGSYVYGDGAKGMNEHALWADLKEVVEVKEAALVGATSI